MIEGTTKFRLTAWAFALAWAVAVFALNRLAWVTFQYGTFDLAF